MISGPQFKGILLIFFKMEELPAFMKGIPEASLGIQKISNELSRSYFSTSRTINNTDGNVLILDVPKGTVFEIRSIQLSAVSAAAPATFLTLRVLESVSLATGGGNWVFSILLDHQEHQVVSQNYDPLTILIKDDFLLKAVITGGTGSLFYNVTGYLLKKEELAKVNIIV